LLRLQTIITILDPSVEVNPLQYTSYFKDVVENENTNANLRVFLSRNFYFLAYQISEHGSRTGEKYITNNLKEYRQFFGAAMIGGFVISLAAFIKVHLTNLHQPYFWASFGYGLNYALAFVIIHLLHGSIATKQPALTASTVASSLDNTNPKSPSLYNLTVMISKVTRSQLASLTGNLIIVFPLTIGIAWAYHFLTGNQIIAAQDIDKTVDAVKPHITNIWFAAVAGVLLFLSGIISGYFDNLVVYANIPKRLTHHRTLRRLLGEKGLQKTANYIDKNLGAIMGNVLLGFGLGFMIFFGKIFGIPLDIRHVTISTGFFGFALFSSGFSMPWQTIVWSGIGLAAIAFTNLLVSFSLALFTALKSRSVSVRAVVPLIKQTFKYFLIHPFDFLFPPKKERVDKKNTTAVNEIAEYAE
jgi:site-specific recombinase